MFYCNLLVACHDFQTFSFMSYCSCSVCLQAQSSSSSSSSLREFEIVPSSGMLSAQSQMEISVQLCSQTVRKYNTELHVDVDGVQQALLILPVTARRVAY